jgi:glycosyltransferase 2 family protein
MSDPRRNRFKTYAGVLVSVLLAALAGYVLWRTFQRIRFADVLAQMQAVPASTLALAGLCAAGAFTVLALYEVAVVRYVKHAVGRAKPILTAYIAFPLGHAVGQAMLSGGALRYRMYAPAGFTAMEVGATVLMCNLAYGLAVGLMLDVSLLLAADRLAPLFRVSSGLLMLLGGIGLVKDAGYVLLVLFRRAPVRLRGWSFKLPTPAMTALQYVVGVIDVVLMSSVLYLLLPESAQLGYLPFVAVYLASVLVGVLSHVPAGLGVIESVLLLLLPGVPPEQLLASVLLYRVIVEIIPLLVALALWGAYEAFAHDGARLRLMRPRAAASRPPGDS